MNRTPAEVVTDVLGNMAEWLPGYTFSESGPQEKVSLLAETDDAITLRYEIQDWPYLTRDFRVTVVVEDVTL